MGKSIKSEFLNLTPFVDLFSVLVVFLLMTAVWTQIAALSTDVENTTSNSDPNHTPPKKVVLSATLTGDHIDLKEDEAVQAIPVMGGDFDVTQLQAILKVWRTKYPDRKDIILNSEDKVPYKTMIKVFDTMVGNDWPDVGVNTM